MKDEHEITCNHCGGDQGCLTNHENYGWIHDSCIAEMEHFDRNFDWDEFERKKRQRIAEQYEH